jgi:hypothetical protein
MLPKSLDDIRLPGAGKIIEIGRIKRYLAIGIFGKCRIEALHDSLRGEGGYALGVEILG